MEWYEEKLLESKFECVGAPSVGEGAVVRAAGVIGPERAALNYCIEAEGFRRATLVEYSEETAA